MKRLPKTPCALSWWPLPGMLSSGHGVLEGEEAEDPPWAPRLALISLPSLYATVYLSESLLTNQFHAVGPWFIAVFRWERQGGVVSSMFHGIRNP